MAFISSIIAPKPDTNKKEKYENTNVKTIIIFVTTNTIKYTKKLDSSSATIPAYINVDANPKNNMTTDIFKITLA